MANTYTSLNFHFIFSTKNRKPFLESSWRERLHEYLGGSTRGLGGTALQVGGVEDHVHLLVSLKPTLCIADYMQEIKKSSSTWVHDVMRERDFHWQEGYSAFSVSASAVESVRRYIMGQDEHHRRRSFRDELRSFLKKSGVRFEERYLD